VTTGGIESLVGITSHGDVACSEEATFTRVDAETAGFIMPTLAALGPGTVAAGARCLYAAQCTGGAGACVAASDNPQLTYCTEPCSASSDCPGQMTCVSAVCRYPVPTPGAFGGACSADSDCIQGVCYESTCSLPCEPGGTEKCPSGASCKQQGDGFDYFCVLPPPATSKKGGCALGSSPGSDGGAWFAGALLVVAGRRRRKLRR
jgi:hypothetical protein